MGQIVASIFTFYFFRTDKWVVPFQSGLLSTRPVLSWESVPTSDPMALKKAVASQPVVVGISTQGGLKLWDSVGFRLISVYILV